MHFPPHLRGATLDPAPPRALGGPGELGVLLPGLGPRRLALCGAMLLCGWLLGCRRPAPNTAAPPASALEANRLTYFVTPSADLEDLLIEGRLLVKGTTKFWISDAGAGFVTQMEQLHGAGWVPVPKQPGGRELSCDGDCRFRYRFALGQAADKWEDISLAVREGRAILAPPSTWLLRPTAYEGAFTFEVRSPEGVDFVTGAPRSAAGYYGHTAFARQTAFAGFGAFETQVVDSGGGRVTLAVVGGDVRLPLEKVQSWLRGSVRATTAFLGKLPVPRALVLVIPRSGRGIRGMQMGFGGASVALWVGDKTRSGYFDKDWRAVHELFHLAVPVMRRKHLWLNEGLATYAEALARARAGLQSEEAVWAEFTWGLPMGLPRAGERGQDLTPSWARTYWGGALYWFLADLEIRRQSGNAHGLRRALRGALDAGASTLEAWPVERYLAAGDAALTAPVLVPLYQKMARRAYHPDLGELFSALGVRGKKNGVTLDDAAPLAHVRRALVMGGLSEDAPQARASTTK